MYKKKICKRQNAPFIIFLLVPAAILFYFLLVMLSLKTVFIGENWHLFQAAGFHPVVEGLLKGLRFDMAALAYGLIAVLVVYFLYVLLLSRGLYWALICYLTAFAFILSFLFLADIQYFEEAGKHFTYEAVSHLNSPTPMISGAFRLHPELSTISLLSCIAFTVLTWFLMKSLLTMFLSFRGAKVYLILFIPIWVGGLVVGMRGGVQGLPLSVGDALISTNPYVNALCLNPLYSTLRTFLVSSMIPYDHSREAENIRKVKLLFDVPNPSMLPDYPLLRLSEGTPGGNRKNVVLFILESWAGKDIGILGGRPEVTPFFDHLSKQGMLFLNFFASGIRTPEGMLSILCSFPNQPIRPVMDRPEVFVTQWRALSQILAEQGYYNIFIHGRDLNFDQMRKFLESIRFHKIIDRRDFPSSSKRTVNDSWPGYDDEEVMRRANEEFSRMGNRPFLGVIYTMNTHIPWRIPADFPPLYPSPNPHQRFLNALHYSDYTLKVFFDLAKQQAYFKNTIFVLTADHAVLMGDQPRNGISNLNYGNQHHIPLLIYSPHYTIPSYRRVVAGHMDILPTILGFLKLKALHASWGRDLSRVAEDHGFAVSVSGNEDFWRDRRFLLVDCLTGSKPLFFDLGNDPNCNRDIWGEKPKAALPLQDQLKAYIVVSQKLLYGNRVYPHN
jgi:phosphoglycerol transferase MdoB-like AlkP superfamily enzyme